MKWLKVPLVAFRTARRGPPTLEPFRPLWFRVGLSWDTKTARRVRDRLEHETRLILEASRAGREIPTEVALGREVVACLEAMPPALYGDMARVLDNADDVLEESLTRFYRTQPDGSSTLVGCALPEGEEDARWVLILILAAGLTPVFVE